MSLIKFKEKLDPKIIDWLEKKGREQIWDSQKNLNSETLGIEKNVFIYICWPSTKEELDKGEKISKEVPGDLSENEVFFRLEYDEEMDLNEILDHLFDSVPDEYKLRFKQMFKDRKDGEIESKTNLKSNKTFNKDLSHKSVECMACNKKKDEIGGWFNLQLYQPKNEKSKELGVICQECARNFESGDIEGLENLSKEYNLVKIGKATCFQCKNTKDPEEAENWWIFQIVRLMEDSAGIGNILTVCNKCVDKFEINNLQELKEIFNQLDIEETARNREIKSQS